MEETFNENDYLEMYPDIAEAIKHGTFTNGFDHYQKFGIREARKPNHHYQPKTRFEKVMRLVDQKGFGLEIGPSFNPIAPKRHGFNVQILDHASADELHQKYQSHGINTSNIEEVDFVWKGQVLSELIGQTECYDWIIASHVIEHVPNMVSFLQQCAALLKPDGVLSLVVPDKRYCFDYFPPVTMTGAILDAWVENRIKPSSGQIFDHYANASSRYGIVAWAADGYGSADAMHHTFEEAQLKWQKSLSTTEYIDVHCWRFTPSSFKLIIDDLRELGLIDLHVAAHFPTVGCEFFYSLKKVKTEKTTASRFSVLTQIKNEQLS